MRKKKKVTEKSNVARSGEDRVLLAYPSDMAATAIATLNRESDNGPESVLTLCQQLMSRDGEFVLASLISGFPVSELKSKDPELSDFKDSFRASLKDNPKSLFSLIGTLKKAISKVQSSSVSQSERQVVSDLTEQFKTKFGL